MTDVKTYLAPAEEKMELAVAYLDDSLSHIRAGKASSKLIDGIRVEYYCSQRFCARCTYDRYHSMGESDVQGNREGNH